MDRDQEKVETEAPAEQLKTRRGPRFFPAATSRWFWWLASGDALRAELGAVFEHEMETGRGFLWLPVLFGTGIALYFTLPSEPSAWALIGLAAALSVSA